MFVEAMRSSDLLGVMRGLGPYTVFAPTNNALSQLGEDTWSSLLKPENKQVLLSILASHVNPARIPSDDVPLAQVPNLSGDLVVLKGEPGSISLQGIPAVRVDLGASNGVVHVIDGVFIPDYIDLGSLQ